MSAFSLPFFLEAVRDGKNLDEGEIRHFILNLKDFPDEQIAAFLAHAFHKPLSDANRTHLTLAMRDSGKKLDWTGLDKPVVDKHSTGGIGDKVTICLAPIVAALGLAMPTIAGRGLGFSGGTVDKLEAIPGMSLSLPPEKFQRLVRENGIAFAEQTGDIAPADKKLYALRDVTATVESIPLITASILSKKLAESLGTLVMDVKWGSGAFMRTLDDARALAKSIVSTANLAGTQTRAFITDMNQPMGCCAGNWCEVAEAVLLLKNDVSIAHDASDTLTLTRELAASLLLQTKRAVSREAALDRVDATIASGEPFEIFCRVIATQGGDASVFSKPFDLIPKTEHTTAIKADRSGFVQSIDGKSLGHALILTKAGRQQRADKIDPKTSLTYRFKIGDKIAADDTLFTLHTDHAQNLALAENLLREAIVVGDAPASTHPLIQEIVT